MKKLSLLLFVALLAMGAMAQTRKVAILETVDRESALSYGIKLMVCSYLSEAITNTSGYEAYDRTDLQQIFDEQDFQRTGNVSDEDIKKIGKMTGVQYVLVTEASKLDENNLFITSKILNVETARVEKTANATSKTDIPSMQKCAQDLASRLLADIKPSQANKTTSIEEGVYIERISSNEYSIGGDLVSRKAYYKFFKKNPLQCIPAYQQFTKGEKLTKAGWYLFGIGGTSTVLGIILFGTGDYSWRMDRPQQGVGFGLMILGTPALLTSVPLLSVGYYKKNNAYKKYNEYCSSNKTESAVTLNLQASSSGLGFALHF